MAIRTLLILGYRAVDIIAFRNKLLNFLMTGIAQLSRLVQSMVRIIGTVGIVALETVTVQRRMNVVSLSVEPNSLFVTIHAKAVALSNKQIRPP